MFQPLVLPVQGPRRSQRANRFVGCFDEDPVFFQRARQTGMRWGVKATRFTPEGTTVGKYGKGVYTRDEKDAAELLHPSDCWMQISSGAAPLFVNGKDAPRGSLAHVINHDCGVTIDCGANCKVVFDDVLHDGHRQAFVVTTRDIYGGHWLFMDYHYRWDAARDGDDPSMGWMRGLRCAVCEPTMPPEGRAVLAINLSPVQAIKMLDVDDFEASFALTDRMVHPFRMIPDLL